MTTLEDITEELKQLPPEQLEKARQFLRAMISPAAANAELADWTMQFAGMLGHWTEKEWADFQAELARTRADLFNRPAPEL